MTPEVFAAVLGTGLTGLGVVVFWYARRVRDLELKQVVIETHVADVKEDLEKGARRFERLEEEMRKANTTLTAIEAILRERGGLPPEA